MMSCRCRREFDMIMPVETHDIFDNYKTMISVETEIHR